MTIDHKVTTTTPQASMIIWNYKERFDSDGLKKPHDVDLIYLLASHVVSISTFKSKSQPSGRFEVTLAPTHNWVTRLTPGSWCVINMTKDLQIPDPLSTPAIPGRPQADEKMVKWFGRIEDIRVSIDIDQETGARKTSYIVTGSDWSSIFESVLYVDSIFRNEGFDPRSGPFTSIGAAERLVYDNQTLDYFSSGGLPTSTVNVKGILRIWGSPLNSIQDSINQDIGIGLQLTSDGKYQMPFSVANYFGFSNNNTPTNVLADIIDIVSGRLVNSDDYKDVKDAVGFIDPSSILGQHSLWQLLLANSNEVLNELITDLRFVDGKANLALYKRIRPFIVKTANFDGASDVFQFISRYQNVKQIKIPLEDVVTINAGVNWKDMINFVEMQPDTNLISEVSSANFKRESQTFDRQSYERNGFKPKLAKTSYLPIDLFGQLKAEDLTKWKVLLREWYFNQHNQLNGSVTFIGQNSYIQVGDNIVIDSQVLGKSRNMNQTEKINTSNGITTASGGAVGLQPMNLVAHVESIRHSFGVSTSTGARSFTTTVQFVRGMILPGTGITPDAIAIDKDATTLSSSDEKIVDVIKTKTEADPVNRLLGSVD